MLLIHLQIQNEIRYDRQLSIIHLALLVDSRVITILLLVQTISVTKMSHFYFAPSIICRSNKNQIGMGDNIGL